MTVHSIVSVEEDHIIALAFYMQKEDRDNAWAIAHISPEQAIRHSVEASIESETWLVDGRVMAIRGVSKGTFLSPYACVWMLGAEGLRNYPVIFLKGSREWVERMLDEHSHLVNYVDGRNKRSLKWLKWLGFTIHPAAPLGIEGRMFHWVEKRKEEIDGH